MFMYVIDKNRARPGQQTLAYIGYYEMHYVKQEISLLISIFLQS